MTSVYGGMTVCESEVADYLKKLKLYWKFEFPIFVYDEKNRPRVWTPDFYLPKLNMFIEVCGSENFDYKYREVIYKKNGFLVVFLHLYKADQWKSFLIKRMMEIEEYRHKETKKMLTSLIDNQ